MKANKTPIALSLLAAATLLVACDRKTTVTETPAGTTATTSSTTTVAPSTAASNAMSATASAMDKAGDAAGDAMVTGKVKTALLADPDVKGLRIDVDTKNGVVTLQGTVDSAALKDRATQVAQGVSGVRSVDNNLAVKTTG